MKSSTRYIRSVGVRVSSLLRVERSTRPDPEETREPASIRCITDCSRVSTVTGLLEDTGTVRVWYSIKVVYLVRTLNLNYIFNSDLNKIE